MRKFNRIYQTEVLQECQAVLSHAPRLIGIDGQAKASKSLGNAIFLADNSEVVKQNISNVYGPRTYQNK